MQLAKRPGPERCSRSRRVAGSTTTATTGLLVAWVFLLAGSSPADGLLRSQRRGGTLRQGGAVSEEAAAVAAVRMVGPPQEAQRLLCREPWGQDKGDAEVWLGETSNSRSLTFSKLLKAPNGEVLGRAISAGVQSRLFCQGPAPKAPLCGLSSNSSSGAPSSDEEEEGSCAALVARGGCPCDQDPAVLPPLPYMRAMLDAAEQACKKEETNRTSSYRALVIGLGAGVLPSQLRHRCGPHTRVESVEYSQPVIDLATRFFGFRTDAEHSAEQGDAAVAARRRAEEGKSYDLVLVDCFGDDGVIPPSCRSEAFVRDLKRILRPPHGLLVQNTLAGSGELLKTYQAVFGPAGRVEDWPLASEGEEGASKKAGRPAAKTHLIRTDLL